jgi:hypothetical protein
MDKPRAPGPVGACDPMTLCQIVADQYGLTTRADLPDFLGGERDSPEVSVHASPVLRGPYGGSGTSHQMEATCLVRASATSACVANPATMRLNTSSRVRASPTLSASDWRDLKSMTHPH